LFCSPPAPAEEAVVAEELERMEKADGEVEER
jgi:hypothetical protein